jgi:hypothetical protein
MGGALQAGLAPWPGIVVAVLAVTPFAVSRERRSLVVAGLLAASGNVGVIWLDTNGVLDSHRVSWPDVRNLVDELWLKIFPVTIRSGRKLFADGTALAASRSWRAVPRRAA